MAEEARQFGSKYSEKQLIEAWRLFQEGMNVKDIAEKTEISYPSIYTAIKDINAYLKGEKKIKAYTSPAWRGAIERLMKEADSKEEAEDEMVPDEGTEEEAPVEKVSQRDNLDKLEEAFASFQEEVLLIIIDEVKTRTQAIVAAKDAEIEATRSEYEHQLSQLKENAKREAEAKKSSPFTRARSLWEK